MARYCIGGEAFTTKDDGRVDYSKLQPIARLGYRQFAVIKDLFEMPSEEFRNRSDIFRKFGR